jgi:hypothetical protein
MSTDRPGGESPSAPIHLGQATDSAAEPLEAINTAAMRPTLPQRRYLERGLEQAGGKLPLFDRDGREVPRKTVEACIAHGWAEAWTRNPIKSDWLVCRLTAAGYRVLGREPPRA